MRPLRYIIPAIFGFACGVTVGFLFIFMLPDLFGSTVGKAIAGAALGLVFGGLIGSISGELNAAGDAGAHRVLVAGFFGAFGGGMGATKLLLVWMLFQRFRWPIPEWAPPLSFLTSLF
jgi:hypothetical protein